MSIFVIDDHPVYSDAIATLIRRLGKDHEVIQLERIAEVKPALDKHGAPILVVLDLKLPDTHGVSGVREVKQMLPEVPILVVSASDKDGYEALAIEAGAVEYLQKSASPAELSAAIRSYIATEPDSDTVPGKLSRRQREIIELLDKGNSNKEIADALEITEHTVKVHLWRLFSKLNVKNRSEAAHVARSHGLM